jgi:cytosine/adenosine deaminase-related metal-dependent hydrolase
VLAGPDFEVLDPGYLVIEGGRITEVGPGRPGDRSGVVLDARDTIVAPAFINAHTHVADGIIKEVGFGHEYWDVMMPPDGLKHQALRQTAPDDVTTGIADALDCLLATGTLTFVDFAKGAERCRHVATGLSRPPLSAPWPWVASPQHRSPEQLSGTPGG